MPQLHTTALRNAKSKPLEAPEERLTKQPGRNIQKSTERQASPEGPEPLTGNLAPKERLRMWQRPYLL